MLIFDLLFVFSGVLGGLGSLLLIATHLFYPSLRTPSRRLLLYLSVCDLGQGLFFSAYLGPWMRDANVCYTHHLFGIFVASASFWWTLCIAMYVCLIIYKNEFTTRMTNTVFTVFHLVSWGLPALSLLPYVLHPLPQVVWPQSGGAAGWFPCVQTDEQRVLFEYFAPLLICWFGTVVLYSAAHFGMPTYTHQLYIHPAAVRSQSELRTKFLLIPVTFLLLRVWGLLYLVGLNTGVVPPERLQWLMYLRAVGDPSQGFWNAILFVVMSPSVRKEMRRTARGERDERTIIWRTAGPIAYQSVSAYSSPTPEETPSIYHPQL
eukprot:NODE_1141_length_1083_cov_350.205029_g872_i0.p1 GENE.NODE_1141_length_1083_cov_350.205029_g872_i0~~NODE_1141_length_1083_cov_350.205029_g872_i0.p1  ORF type:complete len:338 (+),score=37.24 NODE_1141_length_1083_cov_350.205029_g872_i0:60-1016(+)